MNTTLHVQEKDAGQRLDVFCVSHVKGYSRAAIQKAIKAGDIIVNGEATRARYLVRTGDTVLVSVEPREQQLEQQDERPINIPIIYEDEHIVVINKPAGVVVHPGEGREVQTVASWFVHRYPASKHIGDPERPGIVHRLDKDTSGVLILAKTKEAFAWLKERFKKHRVRKEYLGLVFGVPGNADGRITRPLTRSRRNPMRRMVDSSGKPAITEWKKETSYGGTYALLRIFILTGRTHQIRAHMHFLGFPIVGDSLYTYKRKRPPKGVARQMLHAAKLSVTLHTGKRRTFEAPLPDDMAGVMANLQDE